MCHISHSYHSGACLYFTFAFKHDGVDPLAQYEPLKNAIQQAFVDFGRDVVASSRCWHRARGVAGAGHLRPGRTHDRRAVHARWIQAGTSTRARSSPSDRCAQPEVCPSTSSGLICAVRGAPFDKLRAHLRCRSDHLVIIFRSP